MITPSEFAEKTAEYISEHGHTKGSYEDPVTGAVCALGAMQKVNAMTEKVNAMTEAYADYHASCFKHVAIKLMQRIGHGYIPSWNDAPERTAEDVILEFKHVAAELKEEGL